MAKGLCLFGKAGLRLAMLEGLFGKAGLRLAMLEGLFGKAGSAVCEAGSASAVRYFFEAG